MALAFLQIRSVIVGTTVKTDQTKEIANQLHRDVDLENSVATLASASVKAESAIVTSIAEMEAMRTVVVSLHKYYFTRGQN